MFFETRIQMQKTEQVLKLLSGFSWQELILIYVIQMKWDQGYNVQFYVFWGYDYG